MKKQTIIIRVDQQMKDKLIEQAKNDDRTLSNYLRKKLQKIIADGK